MTNKPKNIGTATESAVVKYLKVNGFPDAKRLTLHGRYDLGDVSLGDGYPVVLEVKGGHAAENASDAQIQAWLDEAHNELYNARAKFCVLILKRKGKGMGSAGQWFCYTDVDCYMKLLHAPLPEFLGDQPVVFPLSFFVAAMQHHRPVTGQTKEP